MYVSFCIVLRAFENGVLRNKLDLRGRNKLGAGENGIMKSFLAYTLHQVLLKRSNQERWDGRGV
jgi:hypothetical protein